MMSVFAAAVSIFDIYIICYRRFSESYIIFKLLCKENLLRYYLYLILIYFLLFHFKKLAMFKLHSFFQNSLHSFVPANVSFLRELCQIIPERE